ncbi:PREDICTED: uncharacterized protein LOC18597373 [Theobroma cacao]|uniref:Uncharacterized protein LOC18597373 n=1 Tax=Theobroma cacao TaxID=3641 RepID=A0AB32WL53_THECC|nr:PREDICTED: uncharacterized protein LOC18597373 [Theobroma cacao]
MARTRYHPLPSCPSPAHLCLLILFIIAPPLNGTELVKEVCNHTSDYAFCAETFNTGGPRALAGDLANAALRLAQTKASHAQSLIARLLKNATTPVDRNRLQICQSCSNKAVSELSSANNDFNSDTLDTMVQGMNSAADATKDCQNQIQGRGTYFSGLATINGDLIKLCEICIVSTRYFTVEDFY